MMSKLDPVSRNFLSRLNELQWRAERAQTRIASGRRVNQPSDDPAAIAGILSLTSELARNTQVRDNLSHVLGEVQTADQALGQAIVLLDEAAVLAAQGNSSFLDGRGMATLAARVQGIADSLAAISQTTHAGRYLFSGDQDTGPQYALDPLSPTGVVQLHSAAATRQIAGVSGSPFSVDQTAADIFDARNPDSTPAAHNVFAVVRDLQAALENEDQGALEGILERLRAASVHLNTSQGRYGVATNVLNEKIVAAEKQSVELTRRLSEKADADLTEAILELTRSRTHIDAALAAQAQRPRSSLFDYLG